MLPEHLRSTGELLTAAYPDGLVESDYYAVLALLYDHLSDRNLAEVVSRVFGRDYFVTYNDIAKAVTTDRPPSDALSNVQTRLLSAGYEAWSRDEHA